MKVNLFKGGPASPRPKTAHQSGIRGKSISGPIPITGDDDDFPIRKPGTSYASTTKLPAEPEEFPIRRPGSEYVSTTPLELKEEGGDYISHAEDRPPRTPEPGTSGAADVSAGVEQSKAPEPPTNPPPAPPVATSPSSGAGASSGTHRTSPGHRRANPSSTLRFSQISGASTEGTGQSGKEKPQRKKSTLRGALSKLFGRKKKTESLMLGDNSRSSGGVGAQLHRSVSFLRLL